MRRGRKPIAPAQRFWRKVVTGPDCWDWQGARTPRGYGLFALGGTAVTAHRFSYEASHGPIPAGHKVFQRCENRGCVRPSHLVLSATGRGGRQKLTDDQVTAIRDRRLRRDASYAQLSEDYEVTASHVRLVVRGKRRGRRSAGAEHDDASVGA